MKKLALSLLFSTALVINNNASNAPSNKLPTYKAAAAPIVCGNLTAAGSAGQTVTLGLTTGNSLNLTSDSGNIILQSASGNIILASSSINSSSNNYNLLMVNSLGNIFTANNVAPITCGTLIAGGTAGQVISLGNSTGSINLSGTNIKKPSAGSYNALMIDTNGNVATSSTTTPFSCGTFTAGTTTCGALTTSSINTSGLITSGSLNTGTITCGSFSAAGNAGQAIALGNSSGSINVSATNIKKPTSGNYNFLMVDSNGNMATSTATNPFSCGTLTAGNASCNSLTASNLNVTGSITAGNHTCGSLTAASSPGQGISLGNSSGSINVSATNIQKPSSGNYNLLTIDANGNLATSSNSTPITFGALTASSLNTTGALNAGTTICGALTAGGTSGEIITLGNTGGSINLKSSGITWPSSGNNNLLMINSSGNLTTGNLTSFTCGNLNAAASAGQTVSLGNNTGSISLTSSGITLPTGINNNLLLINSSGNVITGNLTSFSCGNLTAAASAGQTISLGNSTGTISLNSSGITLPTGSNNNFLMLNSSGNLLTSTGSSSITCNNLTANSINTAGNLTAGTTNCGNLTAASTSGQNITLGNSTGTINLISSNITNPSTGNNSLLMINSSGALLTANNTNPLTCGVLNSGTINCGSLNAANNPGQNITLGNSAGTINLKSANITSPSSGNSLLMINSSGNMITGTGNNAITCGNLNAQDTICNNFTAGAGAGQTVNLGNSTGKINFVSSNIINPSSGNYNLLIIDSNGSVNTANTATPITCGSINTNTLTTTGNTTCGNVTANSLTTTGSIISGSLNAASGTGQTVTLGNNTGTIKLISANIINPATGNYNLLTIDSNGNVNTPGSSSLITLGNLNAATSAGQNIILGNNTGTISLASSGITLPNSGNNNLLLISPSGNVITGNLTSFTCGNLTAAATAGQTVALGNSTGSITIAGTNITNPSSGNNSLLMLNSSGNIITGNTTNSSLSCGALTATSLSTAGTLNAAATTVGALTAGTTTTGSLTAAGTAGQTVALGNSTGSITVAGTNITNPSSGNNSLLMLNSSGNIITGTTTNSSFTCGALTASNINTAGTLSAGSTTLGSTNTGSLIAAGTAGQTVALGNNTGSITIASSDIFRPSAFNANLLGITSTGTIFSIGTASSYPVSVGSFTAAGGSGQTVTLGNSIGGAITIAGANITNPSSGNNSLLMLNASGNIITGNTTNSSLTCGALTANSLNTSGTLTASTSTLGALTANSITTLSNGLVSLGNVGGGNGISFTGNSGNLTISSNVSGSNLLLNANGSIILNSTGINLPNSGDRNFLMIGSSGNMITGNTTTSPLTCGALTASSLNTTGTLTAGNTTIGSLTAASTAGQTITLGNTTGSITLTGTNITNPSSGKNSLLMLNSFGNVITPNSNSYINISGTPYFPDLLQSLWNQNSLLQINYQTGQIYTTQPKNMDITCGSLTAAGVAFQSLQLGSPGFSGTNGIGFNSLYSGPLIISSLTSDGGLILGSASGIQLISSALNKPSIGNYSPLYIDSNGNITTTSSSRTYKEKIKQLEIDNNTFDLLEPVSFNYIKDDSKHLQYGFIAEDLINIPCLQNTVIYGHDGKIESVNYQAVFVALTADYLATKKALKAELKEKNTLLHELTNTCISLQNELKMKDEKLNRLENRCQLLEIAISKIAQQIGSK